MPIAIRFPNRQILRCDNQAAHDLIRQLHNRFATAIWNNELIYIGNFG
jgi:hypothetical protein